MWRGRAPGRGGRPPRRRGVSGGGSGVRGAGPSRRGPRGSASPPTDRPGEWLPRAPSPDLTAARRHGARPPDGPVSIPGGEAVGAARRPRGPRR